MAIYAPHEYPENLKHLTVGEEVDLTKDKDGGILKKLVKQGRGTEYPCIGDTVTLTYVGYMGEIAPEYVFDSSQKNGTNWVFEIGKERVIRGLECAVYTMRQGECVEVTIQPIYAWGQAGNPPKVPRDTPVVYVMKLLSFTGEDISEHGDGSVIRNVLQNGTGHSQPNPGSDVQVHIKGFHGDRVFDDRDIKFPYGKGTTKEYKVPVFIDTLLRQFRLGEKSRLKMKSKACYGKKGCPEFSIPPNTDLLYEVHLKTFEQRKQVWEMNNKEKMDECDRNKEKGNTYKEKDYAMAEQFYMKVVHDLELDTCMEGGEESRRIDLLVGGNLNAAMMCMKQEKWVETVSRCNSVLQIKPRNEKALYRKAEALYNKKDFTDAKEDFVRVLEVNPKNKKAKKKIKDCDIGIEEMTNKEKEMCRKMISTSPNKANEVKPEDASIEPCAVVKPVPPTQPKAMPAPEPEDPLETKVLDELVKFINGDDDNSRDKQQLSAKAAKRARQKFRKEKERQEAEQLRQEQERQKALAAAAAPEAEAQLKQQQQRQNKKQRKDKAEAAGAFCVGAAGGR